MLNIYVITNFSYDFIIQKSSNNIADYLRFYVGHIIINIYPRIASDGLLHVERFDKDSLSSYQ